LPLFPLVLYILLQGGDEEKFKLVVEANAVLSDARRRERYDLGEDEDGLNDGGGMGGHPFAAGMRPGDLEELFSAFGGGGPQFGGFGGPFGFSSGGFSGGRSYTHG
jgi:DnaJ family protein C protein 7